ncbi:hypothetical protein BKA93DRAFT_375559 [Sparassis latifolia]
MVESRLHTLPCPTPFSSGNRRAFSFFSFPQAQGPCMRPPYVFLPPTYPPLHQAPYQPPATPLLHSAYAHPSTGSLWYHLAALLALVSGSPTTNLRALGSHAKAAPSPRSHILQKNRLVQIPRPNTRVSRVTSPCRVASRTTHLVWLSPSTPASWLRTVVHDHPPSLRAACLHCARSMEMHTAKNCVSPTLPCSDKGADTRLAARTPQRASLHFPGMFRTGELRPCAPSWLSCSVYIAPMSYVDPSCRTRLGVRVR